MDPSWQALQQESDEATNRSIRRLKRLGQMLTAVIVLFIAVGFILDDHYRIERSQILPHSPQEIHPVISQLDQWHRWSPGNVPHPT